MSVRRSSTLGRPISRRALGAGAAAGLVAAALRPLRAQGKPLKMGVLLARSGVQAGIGQSCQRAVDIAPALLRELGYSVQVEFINADIESNVDVARTRAERLISDGAHVLMGAFDSGSTMAIAQVCEQRGVPFVVNVAASPQLTELGYKMVVRNFPHANQFVREGLKLCQELIDATGAPAKTAVLMRVNDTFGQATHNAIANALPTLNMPFTIVEEIAYDPAAKDLSLEVAKAKAAGADFLLLSSRLNDAILIVKEMVKQRWEPMGIVSPGSPGMYEQAFYDTLGKYSEFCISNVPWVNPRTALSRQIQEEFKKRFPNDNVAGHLFNVSYTFEAIMIAADAYARAGTTDAPQLMAALRSTHIERRAVIGGPIEFDAKGQNNNSRSACVQNRGRRAVVTLPNDAAEMAPVFPVPGWSDPRRA